ncbi:MAG: DeoR/GlpR family DNA-binding transcription regulator [Akkermansiaceae bacterium]|nr:DeoR/GlpR family DNA-binding transcription regulator [Akkermansiaceae bacterium]
MCSITARCGSGPVAVAILKLYLIDFGRYVNIFLANSSKIFQIFANDGHGAPKAHRGIPAKGGIRLFGGAVGACPGLDFDGSVRRDLTSLESFGNLKRTHGGARVVTPHTDEFAFSARDTHQLEEKEAIGRAAAALVQPNESVIIDAGTTAYHVALHLLNKAQMVVTNSLPVANLFGSASKMEVVVSAGVIYPRLGVLVGPLAVETFSKIHADVAIMSAGGIALDGVTNSHALLIDIQRQMLRGARKIILCLDHTKFGRKSTMHLCGLDDVDIIVTDSQAPETMVAALRERGNEVVLAEKHGP